MNYEVFKMLDYGGKECNNDPEYLRDKCNEEDLIKKSFETVNCTWPFSSNKENICQEVEKAKLAHDIGMQHYRKKPKKCLDPCTYLKITSYQYGRFPNNNPKVTFKFPEFVRVTQAYYSYKRINLIAEIGGYVGLFLGVSVYQITTIVDKISSVFTNFPKMKGCVRQI